MGQAIAGRILAAGFELAVHNRTPERAVELVAAGARGASAIADACSGCDVIATMLADDAALEEVALSADGLLDTMAPGAIHLAMGTHGVAAIADLAAAHAAAGQTLVAAPVLGRPDAAAAGQLAIVAGGPRAAVRVCEPLFAVIGRRVFDAGERPEAAAAVKLANGFVLACAIEAMSEAFSLARRFGVAPEVLHGVLTGGLFAAPAYETYGRIIVDERFDEAGFTTRLGLKDVGLMLDAGREAAVPLPSANVVRDRLLGAIAHGDGERDWSVIAREQARAAGLE
jgi:3-hydroxyisobutyrate dehydrogenase-like beta-hydroxyacid dehydrogenase